MKSKISYTRFAFALVACACFIPSQLMAASNDRGNQNGQNGQGNSREERNQNYFNEDHKALVRNYFIEENRQGRCPPGLAKKNNGCNPPGQIKRWEKGQTLQQDVNYLSLPAELSRLLGQPQSGYHYGMVDSDILLLLDGTELVIDAITNLGQ